ncbi:endo-alpha-N-acetylgalactosaminidase family protein [Paenibacillus sp. NPDC056579]|uniref:endo-alpha-N-acetylgalactosaminidase family protein n=1 Tax=Paenibacillus sp. NPDC056579 TaxID=3345871 RepID=UPI00369C7C9E
MDSTPNQEKSSQVLSDLSDTAAGIAQSIRTLNTLSKGQTLLELPAVPAGYEVQILASSREDVIPKDAQVFPVIGTDTTVELVLEVLEAASGEKAATAPITVVVPAIELAAAANKTALREALAEAERQYAAAGPHAARDVTTGPSPLGELHAAIESARAVSEAADATQEQADASAAKLHQAVTGLLVSLSRSASDRGDAVLESVRLDADRTVLHLDSLAVLRLSAAMSDGSAADLSRAQVQYTASNSSVIASIRPTAEGAEVRAGTKLHSAGTAVVTAIVTLEGVTRTAEVAFEVLFEPDRPFRHEYHQTLTMKMFMADRHGNVSATFEQALDTIRKVDRLTRGIPKIMYLVGWQFDGHDTGYPALDVVNPKLKRDADARAEDSLIWLMKKAKRYHTTVSLHINLLDASDSSPLWQEYIDKDVIARLEDGSLRTYVWGYPISYKREWEAGLTTRRIDSLLELLPIHEAGTIHVDAFHQIIPQQQIDPISPYHGVSTEQEVETQKQIIRYFRDKGIDFTSEFDKSYRQDPLIGLQPFAWHVRFQSDEQLTVPARLYIGGDGGDPRFGSSMLGESLMKKDPEKLAGFTRDFALHTLPWYFLNRLDRLADENGAIVFSDGVTSEIKEQYRIIKQGERLLRDGDDVCFPVLWNTEAEEWMAYSLNGCTDKLWKLPERWGTVAAASLYEVGLEGITSLGELPVTEGTIQLTLRQDQCVVFVPAGTELS